MKRFFFASIGLHLLVYVALNATGFPEMDFSKGENEIATAEIVGFSIVEASALAQPSEPEPLPPAPELASRETQIEEVLPRLPEPVPDIFEDPDAPDETVEPPEPVEESPPEEATESEESQNDSPFEGGSTQIGEENSGGQAETPSQAVPLEENGLENVPIPGQRPGFLESRARELSEQDTSEDNAGASDTTAAHSAEDHPTETAVSDPIQEQLGDMLQDLQLSDDEITRLAQQTLAESRATGFDTNQQAAIVSAIERSLIIPPNLDIENAPVVEIIAHFDAAGNVLDVRPSNPLRMQSDEQYRIVANSGVRSVYESGPWPSSELPPGETTGQLIINFDIRDYL